MLKVVHPWVSLAICRLLCRFHGGRWPCFGWPMTVLADERPGHSHRDRVDCSGQICNPRFVWEFEHGTCMTPRGYAGIYRYPLSL